MSTQTLLENVTDTIILEKALLALDGNDPSTNIKNVIYHLRDNPKIIAHFEKEISKVLEVMINDRQSLTKHLVATIYEEV